MYFGKKTSDTDWVEDYAKWGASNLSPVPTPTWPRVSVIPGGGGRRTLGNAFIICREDFKEGDSVQPLNCGQKLHNECMNLFMEHNIANLRAFRCLCCPKC